MLNSRAYDSVQPTCLRIFCSLISFCLSLLGLLTMISRTSWPLLGMSTTKNTKSSRSLVTALIGFSKRKADIQKVKHDYSAHRERGVQSCLTINVYLLSFCVMVPFSSFPAIEASTLLASFAKSRSLTSAGETGTMAKASLSSF